MEVRTLNLRSLLLAHELRLIGRSLAAVFWFCVSWFRTRRPTRLITALPAVLLGVAFLWSIFEARMEHRQDSLLKDYLAAASNAVHQEYEEAARLYFRRAQVLSKDNVEVTFKYASALFELHKESESLQMMSAIAPLRQAGYAPAHRFLIDHTSFADASKSDLFRAIHLGHIIRLSKNNRAERFELLAILVRYKRFDHADALLRETLDLFPEDRLTLARMKAKAGKIDEAREEARLACQSLSPIVQMEPGNTDRRTQLAQGHVFLGEFGTALEILAAGLPTDPSPVLVDAMSHTYERWFSVLPPIQQASQLACLRRLVDLPTPAQSGSTETSLQMISESSPLPLFRKVINGERGKHFLPLLLGSANAASGNLASAEQNLRTAMSTVSRDPTVCNNLAWVLCEKVRRELTEEVIANGKLFVDHTTELSEAQQSSLSEAFTISNEAVQAVPKVCEFRETHAQICSLLGKHQEAVDDLNACLAAGMKSRAMHQTLSVSLTALGRLDESLVHRELARTWPAPN